MAATRDHQTILAALQLDLFDIPFEPRNSVAEVVSLEKNRLGPSEEDVSKQTEPGESADEYRVGELLSFGGVISANHYPILRVRFSSYAARDRELAKLSLSFCDAGRNLLGHVVQMTEEELKCCPGGTDRAIAQLKQRLARANLRLGLRVVSLNSSVEPG